MCMTHPKNVFKVRVACRSLSGTLFLAQSCKAERTASLVPFAVGKLLDFIETRVLGTG
jgi:hypothetical protein